MARLGECSSCGRDSLAFGECPLQRGEPLAGEIGLLAEPLPAQVGGRWTGA